MNRIIYRPGSYFMIKEIKCSAPLMSGIIYLVLTAVVSALNAVPAHSESVPVYGYKVINTYPHDTNSFTQGLHFYEGKLYEGTGLNGSSSVREIDLKTGETVKLHKLENRYFGEGITVADGKIVQLTWRSGRGFLYDTEDLKPIGSFNYKGEGWGITYDGKHLIMSNGSSLLTFLDPQSYKKVGDLEVYDEMGTGREA